MVLVQCKTPLHNNRITIFSFFPELAHITLKSESILITIGISNCHLNKKVVFLMESANESLSRVPNLYFPNGNRVPLILTSEEVIHFLRLDMEGPKSPEGTLEYYREKKLLRGIKLGQHMRYYLPDVIDFISRQSDWTNRKEHVS